MAPKGYKSVTLPTSMVQDVEKFVDKNRPYTTVTSFIKEAIYNSLKTEVSKK